MKNNWKEEFDKRFVGITEGTKRVWWADNPDRIINFIESLLAEQKKELMYKLEQKFENTLGITISDPSIAFELRDGEYKIPEQYISKDTIRKILKYHE